MPIWGPAGQKCGDLCCIVGRCGIEWQRLAGPGWRGSSHLATPVRSNRSLMKGEPGDNLGLSRALRLLARRQEATERPTQVPRVVLRWSGSGEGTGALRGDLDSQWVRTVDGELPEQARAPSAPSAGSSRDSSR